ncbi:hypothetical protein [Acuticoccus kandeliae]|uniref:hypothetical protein n=1 Tax=Acuticoccus kandeliae TaxID=2073160 RepID=UPI000D3E52C8|nr:hypothetical protein [Acuticoccus kandeliae]
MQLVVVGYHRSGTSALTQHLAHCGLFIGVDLLGVKASNPRGHFEDRIFVALHDRILRDNGERWLAPDPFVPMISGAIRQDILAAVAARDAEHACWGFKDPRACLFLDLWRTILSDAHFLVCLRHYASSIDSMIRRALDTVRAGTDHPLAHMHMQVAADPARILRSWISHMLPVLRLMRAVPGRVHTVEMGRLPPDASVAGDLAARFGLPLAAHPLAATFEPGLLRAEPDPAIRLPDPLTTVADRVWSALLAAKDPPSSMAWCA